MAGLPEDVAGALHDTGATTLHRLLGLRGSGKPRHDRFNPLPHDMVVVDETSMVSLPLMARLLDAVRPDATLVLVGDPFQLVSVEAGAVLGEIVRPAATEAAEGPLAADIVLLERVHRFGSDSAIAALADAIRTGDADRAVDLLRQDKTSELSWVDDDDGGIDRLHRETAAAVVEVARASHPTSRCFARPDSAPSASTGGAIASKPWWRGRCPKWEVADAGMSAGPSSSPATTISTGSSTATSGSSSPAATDLLRRSPTQAVSASWPCHSWETSKLGGR